MVKSKRRKQIIIPFERSNDSVAIDVEYLVKAALYGGQNPFGVLDFLNDLSKCRELNEQISICQAFKGKLKSIFMNSDPNGKSSPPEGYLEDIKLLMLLYLDPSSLILRKSLDWITDLLIHSNIFHVCDVQESIQNVCLAMIREVLSTSGNQILDSIDISMGWASSFNCMALLDKDIYCLENSMENDLLEKDSNNNSSPPYEVMGNGILLEFILAIFKIFQKYASLVIPQISSDSTTTTAARRESSAEVIRYAECCGECMRALMTALKSRKDAAVISDDTESPWTIPINGFMSYGCLLLGSDLISKDIVTSVAIGLVHLQWLARFMTCWGSSLNHLAPNLQLVAFLAFTDCSERITPFLTVSENDLRDFALSAGLHLQFVDKLSTLPVIAKSALFRGCINVYDDSALLYVPYCYAVQGIERHVLAMKILEELPPDESSSLQKSAVRKEQISLLLSNIFVAIMSLCNHSQPLCRLYGLQTLEAWFNRVELLESATSSTLSLGSPQLPPTRAPIAKLPNAPSLDSWFTRGPIDLDLSSRTLRSENAVDSHSYGPNDACTMPDALPLPLSVLVVKLGIVSTLLTRAWNHPSKQVNHMVPVVYQRLVDFTKKLEARAVVALAADSNEPKEDVWAKLINDALDLPATHRGRYQALSILLPKVGPERLLKDHNRIISSLVQAMKVRDVASAASTFAGNMLRILKPTMDIESFRMLWAPPFMRALCSSEFKQRVNAADYLIVEALNLEPTCGPYLIDLVRALPERSGLNVDATFGVEQKLWGLVNIVLQLRLQSLAGRIVDSPQQFSTGDGAAPLFVDLSTSSTSSIVSPLGGNNTPWKLASAVLRPSGNLQTYELCWACLSEDENLRLAALTLLTASQRTTAPMESHELGILKATLRYSLKTTSADHRHKIMRVMSTLFMRMKESSRMAVKNSKKPKASTTSTTTTTATKSTSTTTVPTIITTDTELTAQDIHNDISDFCEWLSVGLLENIYPGAPFEREVISLDLLHCALDGLGVDSVHVKPLLSPAMTAAVLNLFMSSWDRTRHRAAELLLRKFPRPLPGFETSASVSSLVTWGCTLTCSAKQREADAGSLMLYLVLVVYSMHLGWDVEVGRGGGLRGGSGTATDNTVSSSTKKKEDETSSKLVASAQGGMLLGSVCDLLTDKLSELRELFRSLPKSKPDYDSSDEDADVDDEDSDEVECESPREHPELEAPKTPPMCHGLMLTLRYILDEAETAGLWQSENSIDDSADEAGSIAKWTVMRELWQLRIQRVMRLCMEGFNLALTIIAEDAQPGNNLHPPGATNGPVNGNNYMFVNTNGYMDGDGFTGDGSVGSMIQRAIIAAWLLLKESATLLARLVLLSPQPKSNRVPKDPSKIVPITPLLQVSDISAIGSVLLDALGRLRHMGAIAETHSALQTVAEFLLKQADRNSSLCRLPSEWLQLSLSRLRGEQQAFILRRSAGFAYSFLSLLRAEPSNVKTSLLPEAMRSLLQCAESALGVEGVLPSITVSEGNTVPATVLGHDSDNGNLTSPKKEVLNKISDFEKDKKSSSSENLWRVSVHALNVMRLILLDGSLGSDLDGYIAQALMIAVRGFRSCRWAIRNSSMMVFAAIVQRVVDNDKNDAKNVRSTTAYEFFHRFPSLFPFLLQELAEVVNFEVILDAKGWPLTVVSKRIVVVSVPVGGTIDHDKDIVHDVPPPLKEQSSMSLFPLLLLLSKLRAAMVSVAPTSAEAGQGNSYDDRPLSGRTADVSLFIPLVSTCASQQVHQVREIAAKAVSALVPLRQVALAMTSLLRQLVASLSRERLPSDDTEGGIAVTLGGREGESLLGDNTSSGHEDQTPFLLPYNEVHGILLQLLELITGVSRFTNQGEHDHYVLELRSALATSVLPELFLLHPLLQISSCPPVLFVYSRLLRELTVVYPCPVTWQLLGISCEANIADALAMKQDRGSGSGSSKSKVSIHTPCLPVLWKESLRDLLPLIVKYKLNVLEGIIQEKKPKENKNTSVKEPSSKIVDNTSTIPVTVTSAVPTQIFDYNRDSDSDPFNCAATLNLISAAAGGGISSMIDISTFSPTTLQLPTLLGLLWHPVSEVREGILSGCGRALEATPSAGTVLLQAGLLGYLMQRVGREKEPPLLQKTMLLLCKLTRLIPFVTLDSSYSELIREIWTKLILMTGVYSAVKVEEESNKSTTSSRSTGGGSKLSTLSPSKVSMAATFSSASALEVMGWIVAGRDGIPKAERETHSREWISLLESATEVSQTLVVREAAARALKSSGVLGRYVFQASDAISSLAERGKCEEKTLLGLHEIPSDFACRLWLVALVLMQDDDVDVRKLTNDAVSEAKSGLNHITSKRLKKIITDAGTSACYSSPSPVSLRSSIPATAATAIAHSPSHAHGKEVWKIEELPVPTELRLVQGRSLESIASCLSIVITWSAVGADPNLYGWGTGARAALQLLRRLGGRTKEMRKILSITDGRIATKIFDKEAENLHSESVVAATVLAAAIGSAVSMLPEPHAALLWKPILKRGEEAIDLLSYATQKQLRRSERSDANFSKLGGGVCFHPEIFCYCFCALRAVGEVARAGRPSVEMFQGLRVTQAKVRIFLDEQKSSARRGILLHPKIFQLLHSLTTNDE